MSEEISVVPSSPPPPSERPTVGAVPQRRIPARLAHWLGELATVFVGVYAAFFLSNYAGHRHDRQRREQLLTWLEEHYTSTLDNSREQTAKVREKSVAFNEKLVAGQMPEVKPIDWTGDYDPSDSASVLQSGGYDLLDIETIRDMRDVESTLRQLVSTALHAQQRSDALILPNRGRDPSVFYDPGTHQLREPYEWVPIFYREMGDDFEELRSKCTKLLAQVRADREHGR